MKLEELRKKSSTDLQKNVQELKKKLSDIRFKFTSNKIKNTKEIGSLRKEIARSLTIINEQQRS